MKIGIITQPLQTNYGGLLQNFALQKILARLGHQAITLDQPQIRCTRTRIYLSSIKKMLLYILGKGKLDKMPHYITDKELNYVAQKIVPFIEKHITRTARLNSKSSFRQIIKEHRLDAIIVGSDQVWRPMYNPVITRTYLDFAQGLDIKRVSYAASFGVDNWEYTAKQTKDCSRLAKLFNAISVREISAINLCKEHLGVKAEFVLDPTLLLDKEDYIKTIEEETQSPGNMFTYILDDSVEKRAIIKDIAKKLQLFPFTTMPPKDISHITETPDKCVFPSVTQWLRSFVDAKFVVCDSFHGAVFSIIFNKPFIIIANQDRGVARFDSLLRTFNLKDRLIYSIDQTDIAYNNIDWETVNNTKIEIQKKSLDFLVNSLK